MLAGLRLEAIGALTNEQAMNAITKFSGVNTGKIK